MLTPENRLLEGKTALVTGAGRGIGYAIAETTETEQVRPKDFTHPQYMENWDIWNPMGRWGQPQDTASAVLYLAGDMAAWVTGTTVHVDGGALAADGWYRMPGEKQRWTLAPVIKDSGFIY